MHFCRAPIEFFVVLRAVLEKNLIFGVSSNSHVLYSDILENLAIVDVPDRLVIPDLRRQEDGSQHNPFPVSGANVDLCVGEEPLQIHLEKHISIVTSLLCLGEKKRLANLI